MKQVVVVGAGPAGLMAAEVIQNAGYQVTVYDAMPSACRKFLLAGVGGMNITHSEDFDPFLSRYYDKAEWLRPSLTALPNTALCDWIHGLGIDTFVGTSGRIFPTDMKAAPLLRNWLKRLKESGVTFQMRHKLIKMDADQTLYFQHYEETISVKADAVVLALGGASWPKLGADGSWQSWLPSLNVDVAPLVSTNCGFIGNWSEYLQTKFEGAPLKDVSFSVMLPDGEKITKKGEAIVTKTGIEGSLVYAFSKYLRDQIIASGTAHLIVDLIPSLTPAQALDRLSKQKPKESFAKYLKRTLKIDGVKLALLHESYVKTDFQTAAQLVSCLKNIKLTLTATKPIDEVISSAGGVCENAVNEDFMLTALPGVFCAGEMLDWEAPTGGYLLTGCFATGKHAGEGVVTYLQEQSE
ncbi:TIGR03862 family flavoprotein [Maribrevibacterium harenarium]|uniref:TIGR03862 family flavoprotein n=1 Tax=Maribrevibacterium harenarium TaxID=2589817 RepID=A0A501W961_9GAMM|nr:TIGR03862 family flavoprotein [Maribrevibacterium harenarium]TPE44594.1 TIGR03862 family flavoprotein [Maribrevibacterium harenarium]